MLQELHLEENRLRDLVGLGCLDNLLRLYLGSNRVQELSELDRLDSLQNLVEISLVNNAVSRVEIWIGMRGKLSLKEINFIHICHPKVYFLNVSLNIDKSLKCL